MATITKDTKVEAVAILDRMLEVVDNDMLARVGYVSSTIVRPDLAEQGAVCGGHNACAIGSLYLAAGVQPLKADDYDLWYMPSMAVSLEVARRSCVPARHC